MVVCAYCLFSVLLAYYKFIANVGTLCVCACVKATPD